MTKILRTASTRRLLAVIGGVLAAIAAGAAIAVAAAGPGPVPPPRPLAQAVHNALAAPSVPGISARVTFTNHLIDSSEIQGSDPLLNGASGRVWLSADHRFRLELQSDNGDAQVVVNNGSFWAYDPSSRTVYEGSLPSGSQTTKHSKRSASEQIPTVAQIQSHLNRISQHSRLSGAIPSDVGGRPAYTVQVSPKTSGGLLGSAQLAWDSLRGVPLRIAVYARGSSSPVLELKVTSVSYGRIPTSDFNVSPPTGVKVVKVAGSTSAGMSTHSGRGSHTRQQEITGVSAVSRRVHFGLAAPARLAGLYRQSVSLLDWGDTPAALLSYGQNLGGIAVIEQSAKSSPSQNQSSSNQDQRGLNIPTVSINGVTGQELDTALGTMIRFTRGGVTYTVLGSVSPATARAAARAL